MTPDDLTRTSPPDATREHDPSALDAGLAAAFAPDDTRTRPAPSDPLAETVIGGRYRLTERIGEGGMGSVWAATQTEPVRRKVAVKVIKAGMDSKAVLARFEAERQALAVMDHPNIAKVLDGGLHDGRPYFVMELVKGVPITQFCDERKLTPAQRLELFVPVCQAIQHAHQKGVIHRDIKPSNVLVALYDDKPVPKVIDFGVAKATGAALTEHTLETGFGAVVGTPAYMSPEQASLNNLDIDTRSDVYSLGILLYELLTGSPPFSKKELDKKGLLEILRVVREEEPPRPSVKLSTADALPSLSASRGTEPKALTGLLRNELDWIVMKALEKDRGRRYETANGFAADCLRYLAGEPVSAHPPSTAYRLKKFVRRNRGQVIAAGLVLLALLAGIAGTTLGLLEAQRQERAALLAKDAEAERAEGERVAKELAEQKRQEAEHQQMRAAAGEKLAGERLVQVEAEKVKVETERQKAEQEKKVALVVKDFLKRKLLSQADPTSQANELWETGGRAAEAKPNPTVRELLDRAAKALAPDVIEANFPKQPQVQLEILHTVGSTYADVGEYTKSIDLLTRAKELSRQISGPESGTTLVMSCNLAAAYQEAGQPTKAIELLEQVLQVCEKQPRTDQSIVHSTLHNLAEAYREVGNLKRSIELFERSRDARVKAYGVDQPVTLLTLNGLAVSYQAAGDLPRAIKLFEQVLAGQLKTLGAEHPETLTTRYNLAFCYRAAGKPNAIELFEEVRDVMVEKLGAGHRVTLRTIRELALTYHYAGRPNGVELLEQARDGQVKILGAEHPDTLVTSNILGVIYSRAGKLPRAIELLEQARDGRVKVLGAEHPDTLVTSNNLALAYDRAGQRAKAIELWEQIREPFIKVLGADHPNTATMLYNLAMAYRNVGKLPQAIELLERVRDIEAKTAHEHPDSLNTLGFLAKSYIEAGQGEKAVALFEETLKLMKAKLGPDHPNTLSCSNNLAVGYRDAGKLDKALPLFEETLKLRKAKHGPDHPATLQSMNNLASSFWSLKRLDKSVPLFEELLPLQENKLGRLHPETQHVVANLGVNYMDAGRLKEALPLLKEAYRSSKTIPTLRWVGQPLLDAYGKAGQPAEARKLIDELLADARNSLPKDSPQLGGMMAQFGLSLLEMKGYTEAEPLLRESLAIREKIAAEVWTTFNTQSMLGGALLGQKKYPDAEPLLLKGYEGMKAREKTIPPPAATRIPEALDRLIELYTATNKPDEVTKYQELRAKYLTAKETLPPPRAEK